MLVMVAIDNKDLYHGKKVIARGEAIAAMDTSVNKLTLLQAVEKLYRARRGMEVHSLSRFGNWNGNKN